MIIFFIYLEMKDLIKEKIKNKSIKNYEIIDTKIISF